MSSTERAPEPTMEEILASIRRIISEDESSSAEPILDSASQQGDESMEAPQAEADERIISDIARVLSETAPPVEDDEDILDLTAELGGAELVEEVTSVEILQVETIQPEREFTPPVAVEAPPVVAEVPQPKLEVPPAAVQQPVSAGEEAASALERALAALRAGQVPTSVAEFMPAPQPELSVPAEPEAASQPEPEQALELEAATETEMVLVPAPEPEPEPPLVTTEFAEVIVEEMVELELLPAEGGEDEGAGAAEAAAPWTASPAPLAEPVRQAKRSNGEHGASPLDATNKTLEDSVKDLLRPMLKQWLDENMPRVLTSALKDELGNPDPRRRQGD